ncbi:MAG: aldo/keto reductase [Rhodobacteraceae bacterium]|nr:aldo/keto reductase [Paracoccaceae bacterium]
MTRILTTPDGTPSSPFAFGTMQFGGRADANQSVEMYRDSRAAGITHFDTAYLYTDGVSEKLLGQMVQTERDQLLIATKVCYHGPATPERMIEQFDICRQRLQLDMVDVLYLHQFDSQTDLRRTMEGFAQLKETGQIRYVGLSNFAAWQVMKTQAAARELGLGIDILQPMYSLVKRQVEVEILPMCADQDIAVASYSPLGGGLLTGKYAAGQSGRLNEDKGYKLRYDPDWMHHTAQALSALAKERGVSPATLAVAWVASHPTRPTPIISARSAEQLKPSLDAIGFDMGVDLRAEISALGPTPPPATDRLEEAST